MDGIQECLNNLQRHIDEDKERLEYLQTGLSAIERAQSMDNSPAMRNAVVRFIAEHPFKWEKLLSEEPYNLHIKSKPERALYIFNYDQIKSDFSLLEVQHARGLILQIFKTPAVADIGIPESETCAIRCYPFDKFFNYGEGNAAPIDWDSARVTEKIDGSIIKYWYDWAAKRWQVSTNGMIDAFECELPNSCSFAKTFGELFMAVARDRLNKLDTHGNLLKERTYMFELVSPYNRVVVPYKEPEAYLIGVRNNLTGEEYRPELQMPASEFPVPRRYEFGSFDEVVESTKTLPFSAEGYVVVDDNFHRVKVKSLAYLQVHHLKDGQGNFSRRRILELIKLGEVDEVLAYFPEFRSEFDVITAKYNKLLVSISAACAAALGYKNKDLTKKEFASIVLAEKPALRPYMFATWDGKDIQPYLDKIDIEAVESFYEEA